MSASQYHDMLLRKVGIGLEFCTFGEGLLCSAINPYEDELERMAPILVDGNATVGGRGGSARSPTADD